VVDGALPGGGGGGGGALAFPVEQGGAEGQVVPEHPFAVDPGGLIGEHAKGGFDLGAAVVAVDAQDQVP